MKRELTTGEIKALLLFCKKRGVTSREPDVLFSALADLILAVQEANIICVKEALKKHYPPEKAIEAQRYDNMEVGK
jgi:hypothetical protein